MSGVFAGAAGLMGNRLEETFAATTGRIARLAEARLPSQVRDDTGFNSAITCSQCWMGCQGIKSAQVAES